MFTKQDLRKLIVPLIIEQILLVAVGMVDTIMISSVGEAAVSGVSLVDYINIWIICIFTALTTGGGIVAGHCLGKKKKDDACETAEQLFVFITIISVIIMVIVLIGHHWILTNIFGRIETDVMYNAKMYLLITAFSIPFIAIYNAGASIFRAMSDSGTAMVISMVMNGVNIVGNYIMIYVLGMGVEGAAIPTLISRIFAAILITMLLRKDGLEIRLRKGMEIKLSARIVKKICYIGIPNALENSVIQFGKILVLSLVSSFGTTALAANAVANNIALFQGIPGNAIGYAMVTVVSQCIGAARYDEADYYTKKLLKYMYVGMALISIPVIILCPILVKAYHLSAATESLTSKIVIYHAICCMTHWSLAFGLPNALRAAGDVRIPLVVSLITMWVFRIGFSFILGRTLGWGVFGVWVAMTIDWLVRAIFFSIRYKNGKWKRNIFKEQGNTITN